MFCKFCQHSIDYNCVHTIFNIYRKFIAEDAEAAMQVSKQVHLVSISYGNLIYHRPIFQSIIEINLG